MHRKSLAVAFALFVGATAQVAAQQAAPRCPDLDTLHPESVTAGESVKISVIVDGGDRAVEPTYNWTVSDGTIESGQGTVSITIDTREAVSGSITATVEVGGFAPECSTTDSVTVTLLPKEEGDPTPEPEPTKPPAP